MLFAHGGSLIELNIIGGKVKAGRSVGGTVWKCRGIDLPGRKS